MTMNVQVLDKWRSFFKSANASIFEILNYVITLAAIDHPEEFKIQRGKICEKLFSPPCTCCGLELSADETDSEEEKKEFTYAREEIWISDKAVGCKGNGGKEIQQDWISDKAVGCKGNGGKEIQQDSCGNTESTVTQGSKYSYSEVEALTDAIDDYSEILVEVLRIKEALRNYREQSGEIIFESLRRLQLMDLSIEILQATRIEGIVGTLQTHKSSQISKLAKSLFVGWQKLKKEWLNSAEALAESPLPIVEEEGLPSPPLDDFCAVFASQAPMELSNKFFDGIDEDGNIDVRNQNLESRTRKKRPAEPHQEAKKAKEQCLKPEDRKNKEADICRKEDTSSMNRKPTLFQRVKQEPLDEIALQEKIEASARKFKEGYQQASKGKNKRTMQVVDLHEIPKEKVIDHRNQLLKQRRYHYYRLKQERRLP